MSSSRHKLNLCCMLLYSRDTLPWRMRRIALSHIAAAWFSFIRLSEVGIKMLATLWHQPKTVNFTSSNGRSFSSWRKRKSPLCHRARWICTLLFTVLRLNSDAFHCNNLRSVCVQLAGYYLVGLSKMGGNCLSRKRPCLTIHCYQLTCFFSSLKKKTVGSSSRDFTYTNPIASFLVWRESDATTPRVFAAIFRRLGYCSLVQRDKKTQTRCWMNVIRRLMDRRVFSFKWNTRIEERIKPTSLLVKSSVFFGKILGGEKREIAWGFPSDGYTSREWCIQIISNSSHKKWIGQLLIRYYNHEHD